MVNKDVTDLSMRIRRGDIFYVHLSNNDDKSLRGMGFLLGKTRPCLVVTADEYNTDERQAVYGVLPIKTRKEESEFSVFAAQEYIPIRLREGKDCVICVSQLRTVNLRDIKDYVGTVSNKSLMKDVNDRLKKVYIGENSDITSQDLIDELDSVKVELSTLKYKYSRLKYAYSNNLEYNEDSDCYGEPSEEFAGKTEECNQDSENCETDNSVNCNEDDAICTEFEVIESQNNENKHEVIEFNKSEEFLTVRKVKAEWSKKDCASFLKYCETHRVEKVMQKYNINCKSTYSRVKATCKDYASKNNSKADKSPLRVKAVKELWSLDECKTFIDFTDNYKRKEVMELYTIGSVNTFIKIVNICKERLAVG